MMAPGGDGSILGITDQGELIRSPNDGINWLLIKNLGIRCTDNSKCKLFATPKGTIFIYGGYGGKHFIRIGNKETAGIRFKWVESMHITPFGDVLIVAVPDVDDAYEHVFISKDDGMTWKQYFDNDHGSRLYVSPKGTLFGINTNTAPRGRARISTGVRFSKEMEKPDDFPFSNLTFLMTSPSGNILASATRGKEKEHYFISYDDGITWEPFARQEAIVSALGKDRLATLFITEHSGKIMKYISTSKEPLQEDFIIKCRRFSELIPTPVCDWNSNTPNDIEIQWRKYFGITDRLRSVVQQNAYGTYFLISPKGFYRSVDNGVSWEKPVFPSYLPVDFGEIKVLTGPNQSKKVYLNWVAWPDI